ncbi:hypothetical protein DPV78_006081 [Talaromyces pinophilus]|nr:hypothetical protein DPV78_006081 [Talaromyces pinophilus]
MELDEEESNNESDSDNNDLYNKGQLSIEVNTIVPTHRISWMRPVSIRIMRRIGEIIIFKDIIKPYLLQYAAAKEFNNSKKISEAL